MIHCLLEYDSDARLGSIMQLMLELVPQWSGQWPCNKKDAHQTRIERTDAEDVLSRYVCLKIGAGYAQNCYMRCYRRLRP